MKLCLTILLAVTAASRLHAQWIQISSPNFDLITNSSESAGRKTLLTFEQARDFFVRELPALAGSPPRATIIGFAEYADYKPFNIKQGALAYYLRPAQGDNYIVISDLGLDRTRIAIHEYVHLLVSHTGLVLPPWLNEGMAEVYSTLEERDGKLALGTMQADRIRTLNEGPWMHLPALFNVGQHSPEYNEQARAGLFYAESFALTHMLMLGEGYTDKFFPLVERISQTGSTLGAFSEIYGRPAAEIEKELKSYFYLKMQGGPAYKAAGPKVEIGSARPLGAVPAGIDLAILSLKLGRTGEARLRLMDLEKQHPRNGDLQAALAYVDETRDVSREDVLDHYRAALALHPDGWLAYWNYARFLEDLGGDLAPRIDALQGAVQRNPDLAEARLLLGVNLCNAGRYADALTAFRQAPLGERAAEMFAGMSLAALGLKQVEDADRYAGQARSAARTPNEKTAVERLLAPLRQGPASVPGSVTAPPPDDDSGRPTLRRKSPPAPAKKGMAGQFRP